MRDARDHSPVLVSEGRPFFSLVFRTPRLRLGTIICVALAMIVAVSEVAVALSMIPVLTSLGIDAGTTASGFVARIPAGVWLPFFAIAAALRAAATWQSSVKEERYTQELVVLLQARIYRALAGAHWDSVRRLAPPRITSALQTQVYDAASGFSGMIQVATATLLVIGYLVSSAFVFPLVLPVLLVILLLMWLLSARHSDNVMSHSEDYVDATTQLHQRYEDWVAVSRIGSLGGIDSRVLADRFERGARKASRHAVAYTRSSAATQLGYQTALVAGILIGVPVAWQLETPPALLIFGLLAFLRVLPRAGSTQVGYQEIVNATAPLQAIERLAEQLERDPVRHPAGDGALAWKTLELSGIGVRDAVRDENRRWILRDIDVHLAHGEWLALTGPTGAGKTTLADVMLMLVRPDAGNLVLNGREVDEDVASLWRRQAAYVPQDVVLFDASLRANLTIQSPDATDEVLAIALGQAAAEFVFERLPDGLDTQVGPGGRWLSGGERQRIGIARALLSKPGFLVLDEPTAAVDADTQARLMQALATMDHTMSVLFITHRPELLQLADRIIGIEDGRITRRDDGFRRTDPDPRRR